MGPHLLADAPLETKIVAILIQLSVIILAARAAALIARKLGQPAVVGEILAGLVLGPSLLGRKHFFLHPCWQAVFHPSAPGLASLHDVSTILSQLGLIFLLFLIGLEFDFKHLRTSRGASLLISITGVVLPFVLGVSLAYWMYPHLGMAPGSKPLGFALFMGTAMSITAIPILGRIMMEMNIARSRLGAITITAAAVDDACGWILLATVSVLVRSHFDLRGTLIMIAQTLAFALGMSFIIRPWLCQWARSVIRNGNGSLGLNSLAILIAILFTSAIVTSKIGIFAIFGAFILGAMFSEEHAFRKAVNDRLRDFVTAFFLPIFFTYTGLQTDIGEIHGSMMWLFAAAVSFLAVLGKFGGCSLAAKFSGFNNRESIIIGIMMNTRALMELIVINKGLELGVIPPSVFCMLVIMAVLTTIMTSPLMLRMIPGTDLEPLVRQSGFLRSGPNHRRAVEVA
jgi:Kef-type K+ transport system membrane component KefB